MSFDININDLLYDEINNEMQIDIQNHIAMISQSYSELSSINEKPTIILIGQSGVGKSSLINSIFQEDVAIEGEVSQTTEEFDEHSNDTLTIYDSKGFSSSDTQTFIERFVSFLKELDKKKKFYFVWFIINSAIGRLQPFEEEICQKVLKKIPVCFVLNKSDISSQSNRQQLKKSIEELELELLLGIFEVISTTSNSSQSSLIKIDKCIKCNMDELVYKMKTKTMMCIHCMEEFSANSQENELCQKTISVFPEMLKKYFISTLKDQMKMKNSSIQMELIEFGTKILDWSVEDTLNESIQMMKSCGETFGFTQLSNVDCLKKSFALLENVNKGITKKLKSLLIGDEDEEKSNAFSIVLLWYRMMKAIWTNFIHHPLKSISNDNASEVVNETVGLLNTKALEQIRIKLNGFGIEVLLKEVDEWDEYDKIETLLNIKENVVE